MGQTGSFEHHTMLVHESVKQADHKELADTIRAALAHGGWYTPRAASGSTNSTTPTSCR